jgi:hypothetical protein
MDNNKLVEIKQKLASLEMTNSSLQKQLENQKKNVTIGNVALVVSIVLTLASIGVGAILLIGVIIYLVIAVRKKNTLINECNESERKILTAKNELIAAEHS